MSADHDIRHEALRDRLVIAIGLATLVAAIAMFVGLTLVFAWGISLILTLCAALGVARRGSLGRFRGFLIGALVVWVGSFSLMHALPASIDRLVLGLPPATAAALCILWWAPLLFVTLPYGLLFDRDVLSEDQVAELERRGREAGL